MLINEFIKVLTIYTISGLGADERVFDHLNLDIPTKHLPWIPVMKGDTLESYATRLSKSIDQTEPFGLLGLSFGGLVAIEIQKRLNPEYTILISSIETKQEIPLLFRFIGKTRLLNVLPKPFFKPPITLLALLFGTRKKQLLKGIMEDTDVLLIKWALQSLCTWNNLERFNNLHRIHGTVDRLLMPAHKEGVKWIKNAGHLMIVDRSQDVNHEVNFIVQQSNRNDESL